MSEWKTYFFPVFRCPEHGVESQSFCVRAFRGKHLDKWEEHSTGPVRHLEKAEARKVRQRVLEDPRTIVGREQNGSEKMTALEKRIIDKLQKIIKGIQDGSISVSEWNERLMHDVRGIPANEEVLIGYYNVPPVSVDDSEVVEED